MPILVLGKPEHDAEVRSFLSEACIAQPLRRRARGEEQVNIMLDDMSVELCFVVSDSLPFRKDDLMEGELVLDTVFVHRKRICDGDQSFAVWLSMDLFRGGDAQKVRATNLEQPDP